MKQQKSGLLFFVLACAGCANNASTAGKYAPGCVAYAGDTIELSDGSFVWDKFTDQVIVDNDGNKVDPFPGFPVRGTYRVEDDVVRFSTDVGGLAADMHLVRHSGEVYLLSGEQFDEWRNARKIGECALRLGAADDD